MGFRITTNMMMRNYRSNLQNSTNKLQNSWDKALKQRNFTSYAEDPGAATQAFTLRRAYYRNSNHLANTETVRRKFESASTAMGTVSSDLADKTARAAQLYAQNDPTSGGRASLGQVLNETAKSAVQTLNIRYGDHFIFAGNDGLNVPFSWDEKTGNLLYRGVNVNAGGVEQPSGNPPFGPDAIPPAGDPNYSQEWVDYYKDQDDLQKLKAMSEETNYVDIGMGLSEENGKLVTSSAFNSSVNGLSFLGYGVDEDGDPKNIVSLMKEIGDIYSRCSGEDGEFAPGDKEVADRLVNKLKTAQELTSGQYVELDAKVSFINTNKSRLEDEKDTVAEQILGIEQIDMAEAITNVSWEQYCYNAALKIGNQLLSQSLIDYMN